MARESPEPTGASVIHELLVDLSPSQTARVLSEGERRRVASGTHVFRLGGDADRLYLVETGRVMLTMPLRVNGRDQDVLLEEKTAGETVGWSAMVPPYRFTLSAMAASDAELVALPRARLEALFAADKEIASIVRRNLGNTIGQRLHKVQAMWLRELQRAVDARLGGR